MKDRESLCALSTGLEKLYPRHDAGSAFPFGYDASPIISDHQSVEPIQVPGHAHNSPAA